MRAGLDLRERSGGREQPTAPEVPGARTAWRADVQGLRAVAVLAVVAFHADLPLPGGFVGVDVFFVVSGFVITRLLLGDLEATGTVGYGAFYARRVRRLLPALAVTILVVVATSLLVLSPLGPRSDTAATGAAASAFVANVQLSGSSNGYFDVGPEANALLHTWSLSVEEQYYLVFPALLALAWWAAGRRARPRVALGAYVAVGAAVSLVACCWLTARDPTLAFYASPARAWEFAAGALVALATTRLARLSSGAATALGLVGLAGIATALVIFGPSTAFPGPAAMLPVSATMALLAAGAARDCGPVSAALAWRPLTWLGDRSYGWYLWHWPAIVFARAVWDTDAAWVLPAVAVAALVPTCWSYRWLEQPLRRAPTIVGRRAATLAAVCVVVPLAVSLLVWSRGDDVAVAGTVDATDQFGPHLDAARGCNRGRPRAALVDPLCTWRVPSPRGRIVLVGDSNAGHLSEGVLAAGRAEGYDVTISVMDGCPFARLTMVDNHPEHPVDGARCRSYVDRTLEALTADPPALVVIGSVADLYTRDPGIAFAPEGGPPSTDQEAKTIAWEQGLRHVVATLTGAGTAVALVHPVPHFLDWDPRTCAPARLRRGDCGRTIDVTQVDDERGGVVAAERAAATAAVGAPATTVDLVPELCADGRCTTNDGGRWRYHDGVHLTVGASTALQGTFADLIESTASDAAP